jgi:hypothetical protein
MLSLIFLGEAGITSFFGSGDIALELVGCGASESTFAFLTSELEKLS